MRDPKSPGLMNKNNLAIELKYFRPMLEKLKVRLSKDQTYPQGN